MSAADRDALGTGLKYRQDPKTGTFRGCCIYCDAHGAIVSSLSYTCPACDTTRPLADMMAHPSSKSLDGDGWPDVPDVPGRPIPETLPVDALPDGIREHVESVTAALQVPSDLPLAIGLGTLSAALAGRVEVAVKPGWKEGVGLYVAPILVPASRKSPTFDLMTSELRALEDQAMRDALPRVLAAQDVVEVAERSLHATKAAAAKGKASKEKVEAARFELQAAMDRVPPNGRLLAGDITPEAMVMRMADQGGRLAILEPEPGPLQLLAGRYSDSARLDEIKKAWSGETITVDRVGRPPLRVRRPALTLALCVQPGVLEALENGKAFRHEGVLARFLWVIPPHGLGTRRTGVDVPALDERARRAFVRIVRMLWGIDAAGFDDDGAEIPHRIELSEEALHILHDYEAEVEPQLADGGIGEPIRDWLGKAAGQAVRVAALLELAQRAADELPLIREPLSARAMGSAVRIMRALTTHALAVLAPVNANTALLAYVLKRSISLPPNSTVRDLFEATKGRASIDTMESLEPLLNDLMKRGCIRMADRGTGRPGRPPSPGIEIHPALCQSIRTIRTNTPEAESGTVVPPAVAPEFDPLDILQEVRS